MYYQEKDECMSRDELKKLQDERLVNQIKRVYNNVECYRNKMDEAGVKPEDIKGVDDLHKLPFSYKTDLRDYYPFGLFAAPKKDIVRVHASSGTTGKRIVVGYTRNDLEIWKDMMARQLIALGVTKDDVVQVSFGYGLFTGGFGAHMGAEKIGCLVIPNSSGNTARQIETMIDFGTTVLYCTPSYAMYLAETAEQMGVIDKLKLRMGIFGAEPWTEEMRQKIEKTFKIKAYDVYGLTEILGPGVSYECEYQAGMHINEDHFIAEIIDPETLEVLPYGEIGELVFTTITKEGSPIIRYRTRDLCQLIAEPCKCGRTHIRMKKPQGRSDDMLIIRGVNVFPSQIEEVLLKVGDSITPNYQIIVDRVNNSDTFDILVEMSQDLFSDDVKSIEKVQNKIKSDLRATLGIGPDVKLVSPNTIQRSEGKAKRVIDNRKLI